MDTPTSICAVCEKSFQVRFRYQVREERQGFVYVCSQTCHQRSLSAAGPTCSVCATRFVLEYPYQVQAGDGASRYFCSTACRDGERVAPATPAHTPRIAPVDAAPAPVVSGSVVSGSVATGSVATGSVATGSVASSSVASGSTTSIGRPAPKAAEGPRRIAVFNHKGGTGKTTTAVNLAAGLAETGQRVLLVDADGQGNVGASLGIVGERTLYHVLVTGAPAQDAAVPVRQNLDVLTSNELLAAAELYLAERQNRHRIMRERLGDRVQGYDVVVIDCAPALSLMNQNALIYADSVLVPVSCDYLSLVGVRQVLRTLKNVRTLLKHPVQLLGVLPTFYDMRNKIAREAVDALTEHFGDRCLPPIRVNTKLREAPSAKQTIFEYAPESNGALDYLSLVERIARLRGEASWVDDVSTELAVAG